MNKTYIHFSDFFFGNAPVPFPPPLWEFKRKRKKNLNGLGRVLI